MSDSGMKKFLVSVMAVLLTGCATTNHSDIPEAVREGVYAMADATHAGRYDLAEQYADNITRIVPAPKARVKIVPLASKTAPKINVVPVDAGKETLSMSDPSPELEGLLATPGATAAKVAADAYQAQVDAEQVREAKAAADDAAKVQAQKIELASQAKWKYIVLSTLALICLTIAAYVAWKLKWVGL